MIAAKARRSLRANVTGEGGQDERIVLKKIAGEKMEFQIADRLGDHGVVVGGDHTTRLAEEQRGAALKFARGGACGRVSRPTGDDPA